MAKRESEHEAGMSPRKALASSSGSSFGAKSYAEAHGGAGEHPDHTAHTGMKETLGDNERATPPAIHHTKGHLPAQAAPRHGPHHPGGYGEHFRREEKA